MTFNANTNMFQFIAVNFYDTMAAPKNFFSENYEEMPEYEEEKDFDYDKYCDSYVPKIQEYANCVADGLAEYGIENINVKGIGHPREYNFNTDWADVDVELSGKLSEIIPKMIESIFDDKECVKYFKNDYRSRPGYIFLGPESVDEFKKEIKNVCDGKDTDYYPEMLLSMYLTLAFIKCFGRIAGEKWDEITEEMARNISYDEYAVTELLIPEGMEYLFKDVYTWEADDIYHRVLDKFGWAWRSPEYKSETELCAMLKWAKKKGLALDDLKAI